MKNLLIGLAVLAVAVFVYFKFFKKETPAPEPAKTARQRLLERIVEQQGAISFVPKTGFEFIANDQVSIINPDASNTMPSKFAIANGDGGSQNTFETCVHKLVGLGLPGSWAWEYCSKHPEAVVEYGGGGFDFSNVEGLSPALGYKNLVKVNGYQS